MERICIESTNYTQLKGSHMFAMAVEKLKPFPRISGYAELPRQEMYWERRKNYYNLVVSATMTKMEFLESKQYLHLADNNAFNSLDKFAKVRPLFNAINEQSMLNHTPTLHVSPEESMVSYFKKHGAKYPMHSKPIKFGFKLWVMAIPLRVLFVSNFAHTRVSIQLCRSMKRKSRSWCISSCNLKQQTSVMQTSNYHILMENYFTSPALLRHNGSCCSRNGESKPNGKCFLERYGKNEQREAWLIRCGYWFALEHHCSTLERQ